MSFSNTPCIAFAGDDRIASGPLMEVARQVRAWMDDHPQAMPLIFQAETAEPIEIDWRGSPADVVQRLDARGTASDRAKPGRPKLGVIAREVTLLPRHWEWLSRQPGGASVTLRKLVEEARRQGETADRVRSSQEAAYRFMSTIAGNAPAFEEAARALFSGNGASFKACTQAWPADVRDHARTLAAEALQNDH